MLSMVLDCMEYIFGQFELVVPTLSPASLLPRPNQLTEGAEWDREKASTLIKYCLAAAETLVCYQHWFGINEKHSTHTSQGCAKESSILNRPSAVFRHIWYSCEKLIYKHLKQSEEQLRTMVLHSVMHPDAPPSGTSFRSAISLGCLSH